MSSENRARNLQIKVRVNEIELEEITKIAKQCDLKPSTLLRELGLGHKPKSTVDIQAFEELANLHGDLGRVGGLLKLWLSDDSKSGFGRYLNIPELVDRLLSLQKEIGDVARKI